MTSHFKENWPAMLNVTWKAAVLIGLFLSLYLRDNFTTKQAHEEFRSLVNSDKRDLIQSINAITTSLNQIQTRLEVIDERYKRLHDGLEARLSAIERRRTAVNN